MALMYVEPATVLLFGLCCAIAVGHFFTGIMGFMVGRQRSELNALFTALTFCAGWTVFWLGAYQMFTVEQLYRLRMSSQLVSGYCGPLLFLFCWGLVRPMRPLPRWSLSALVLGLPGTILATYGAANPDTVQAILGALHRQEDVWHPVVGPLFVVHSTSSIVMALASLGVLIHAILTSQVAGVRTQASWMLLAALTTLSGFVFANMLPFGFGVMMPFYAPISTVAALGIAYKALLSSRNLISKLQTERDNLSLFVPDLVAQRAETATTLGGDEAEVAVLFTDLRGFTALSEDLDPSEVVTILNHYLGGMTEVVQTHGGLVDKYIGDAVLAVFGLEPGTSHPCQAAYAAALDMQRTLNQLNEAGLTPGLRMGIGIHFGTVVHGNVGSADRMSYTVLGDTVNLASRVESMTKTLGVPLVLTEQAAAHMDLPLQDLGEHPVRGRRRPVRLFGLDGPT